MHIFTLQQISGAHASRNYSDQKIEEFKVRVNQLQKDHKHFVAKVKALDPSYRDVTPWELRVYHRKRSHGSHTDRLWSHDNKVSISRDCENISFPPYQM